MADFDATGYFVKRTNADINSKIQSIRAASQEKISALAQYNAQEEAKAAESEQRNAGSVVSILQDITGADKNGVLAHDGLIGAPINNVVALGSGAAAVTGYIGSGVHEIDALYHNSRIPQQVKEARGRMLQGLATPADNELLALPDGDVAKRPEPTDYTQKLRKDFTTNLQRVKEMETSLDKAALLRKSFDLSSAVHTGSKDQLTQELGQRAEADIETFRQGYGQVKNGEVLSGLGDMATGLGGALSEIPGAAMNNKLGAATFLAENTANIVASAAGRIPQMVANVGYGLDAFGQGTEDFRKKNNGELPSNTELAKNAALAVAAVGMEYAGDKLSGVTDWLKPAAKAVEKDAKSALKQALGIASNPLTRTAKAVVEGGAGEFFTEATQTTLENAIKNEDTTLNQAFEGGAIGAIIGGVTGTASHLGKEATGTTDGKVADAVARRKKNADFGALVKANDTTDLLNPESKSYDPVKAVTVLAEHARMGDTTPEAKTANLVKSREVVQSLEAEHDRNQALLDVATVPSELELAKTEILSLNVKLSQIDPANTEDVAKITEAIAFREQAIALSGDKAGIKQLTSTVSRSGKELSSAREVQEQLADRLRASVSVDEVTAHVKAANKSISSDDMPDTDNSMKSVEALVNLSIVSPEKFSPDQALQLADNKNNVLTTQQRTYFREFSDARIAQNDLMTLSDVSKSIVSGTERDTGLIEYNRTLGQALEAGDKKTFTRYMTQLANFAASHAEKMALSKKLFADVRVSGDKQVLRVKDGGWEVKPSGKPLSKGEIKTNGGFEIHPNSGEYVSAIATESAAINQVMKAHVAAYTLKFGAAPEGIVIPTTSVAADTTKQVSVGEAVAPPAAVVEEASTNVSKVNTSTERVQKTEKSVQVAQTAAAPTSVAPTDSEAKADPVVESSSSPAPEKTTSVKDQAEVDARPESGITATQAQYDEAVRVMASSNEADYENVAGNVATLITAINDDVPVKIVETPTAISAGIVTTELIGEISAVITDRTFRELTVEENTMLQVALTRLREMFPDEVAQTSFLVHTGVRASASAFTGFKAISLNTSVFTRVPAKDDPLDASTQDRFTRIVAHELGHVRDKSDSYSSDVATTLQVNGAVFNEIKDVISNLAGQKDIKKAYALYALFNHIINNTNPDVKVHRELYAQIYALYFVNPELLNEYLPRAAKAIQQNHGTYQAGVAGAQSVPVGQGSADAGGSTSVDKDSGTSSNSAQPDGSTESATVEASTETASEPAGLDALVGDVKAELAKPYIERNLLVAHFSQAVAGITAASQRPLVAVKNFITSVGDKTIKFSDYLSNDKLTDKQLATLEFFGNTVDLWDSAIQARLVQGDRKTDGTYDTSDKRFYQNPFNWMIKKAEDGSFSIEENTTTALVYGAITAVLELADAPRYNSAKTLNAILGRNDEAEVPDLVYQTLGTVGTRANLLRNSSGKTSASALGLKVDQDGGQNLMPQMEGGMGGLIEAFLLDLGLIVKVTKTAAEMNAVIEMTNAIDGKDFGNRMLDDAVDSIFIGIARDPATGEFTPKVKAIIEAMKGSSNVLDKLFSVETQLKFPSFTPTENTQKTTKTGQQVPDLLTETNDQNRNQGNYARKDMWKLLNVVSGDIAGAMAGVTELSEEKTQVTKQRSLKAKNDGLWRELNRYHDYMKDVLVPSLLSLDQPLYFDYSVWLQQRVGIETNVINPQTSKAHRALFFKEDWKSEVMFDNEDMLDNFFLRVGEGFGVKTERTTVESSLSKITTILEQSTVQAAIDVIQTVLYTDKTLSKEDQNTLLDAVNIGGENFHTLDALVAMAHYYQAESEGKPSFTTHIQAEVDGVANGPILAHALFGAAPDAETLNTLMERGGIYTEESGATEFNEWKDNPTNHDLYENTITRVINGIAQAIFKDSRNKTNQTAVYFFTGALTKDDGNISSDGRNIIKGPVTEMVFGSGIPKSLNHMAELFIGKIYDVFEKSQNGDEKYPKDAVIKQINSLLKTGGSTARLSVSNNLVTNYFKDPADIRALKKAFGYLFNKTVTETIETNFADFIKRRDAFTQTAALTHGLYATVYDAMRKQLVDKLVADDLVKSGTGIPSTYSTNKKTGVVTRIPLRDLSKREERALEKQLAQMFPVAQTLFSIESNQPKSGLRIGKMSQKVSDKATYETKVNLQTKNGGDASMTVRGFETVHQEPGVGMLPLMIHSTDSYISHMTQKAMQLWNIHDAVIGGLNNIHEASEQMNAHTFHALLNYSPMQEMHNSLANTIKGLDAFMKSGTPDPAVAQALATFLAEFAAENELPADNILTNALQLSKDAAALADTVKLTAMQKWVSVNQYARENSSYMVTEQNQAVIAEKLAEVTHESDALSTNAVSDIDAAMQKTVSTVYTKRVKPKKSAQSDDMPDTDSSTNTFSTHDIYNALDSGAVSSKFDTHLRDVLTNIVEKLHGAFGSFKAGLMKDTPNTAQDVYAQALATDKAPFAYSLNASGFKFSDQQAFVAEQIHATILSALESNDGRNTVVYSELSKLFRETRARLTPKDFDQGDMVEATALYNRIFNEIPGDAAGKSNYLAEFAALGLAHEGFNKLLQVPTKMAPAIMVDRTIAGMLARLFNKILELFNGKLTNTVNGQNADVKLKALVSKLVEIEVKRTIRLNSERGGFMKLIDKQAQNVRMGKKSMVSKLAHSTMFMKNKNVFIASASGVVATLADSQVGLFFRNIDKLRNEHFSGIPGVVSGFLGEMNGPKPVMQGLLRATKFFEGQRKKIITMTNKFVLQAFDNQGQDIDDDGKRSLTKVLLHTGAHVLLEQFDTKQLEAMLKDSVVMDKEINAYEAKLNQYTKAQKDFFIEQSRALGYYLVSGRVTTELMLKNANNIAKMYLSAQQNTLTEAQVKEATKIIDELTSLYAMSYTTGKDKDNMIKILEQEHKRTDGGNGVRLVMLSHQQMEAQSKERLFGESQTLMVKGYVPEIYNPHTDVKAANAKEGRLLEDLGYERGASVGNDPLDPSGDAKHLYVLRDGGALPWLSGIFSFTGMRSKGTKHHGNKNFRMQQSLTQTKQAAVRNKDATQSGSNFDPLKVSKNHMVPLLNDNGVAVNYQYMMQTMTKDLLLQRDTRFDSVMGALNGSIYDKENSATHNRKAIEVMFKEFDEGYNKEPKAYLEVSATSKDPELRELYQMLPQSSKDAIREVWGKDAMMVRASQLDIAFGYRKLSLSNAFDKEEEDRNFAEESFVWFSEAIIRVYAKSRIQVDGKKMTDEQAERYAKRAAIYVRKGENVWQALVKETKDIFVIKSGVTALANIVSNMTLLKLYGVSNVSALRDMRIAWVGAQDYSRDTERLFMLESQLASGSLSSAAINGEIRQLKDAIARNPVRELIEAGLMPTIVEDISESEDQYSFKSEIARKTEKYTNKLNKHVKNAAKQVYMAHDTQVYKTMNQITQLSDFVARYALYQHLITRKDNPIEKKFAIQEASDAFINYDIPMHRKLQYLDDNGIMMFTKYFLRVQRVIRGRFKHAPGKVAMLLLAQGYLDWLPSTLDASILFKFGNNPLSMGAMNFPGSLDEMMTTKAALSLFK